MIAVQCRVTTLTSVCPADKYSVSFYGTGMDCSTVTWLSLNRATVPNTCTLCLDRKSPQHFRTLEPLCMVCPCIFLYVGFFASSALIVSLFHTFAHCNHFADYA